MTTREKTKGQLIIELAKLRKRVYEMEIEEIQKHKLESDLNILKNELEFMSDLLNGSELKVKELKNRIKTLEEKNK